MKELKYPKSFPTSEEERFLKMILSNDKDFAEQWKNWKDSSDFENINFATMRLFPLVYRRMSALGMTNEPLYGRIKGIYRSAWVKNQRILAAAKEIIEKCESQSIPVIVLKGIPLIKDIYSDIGARFLGDADILIDPSYAPEIIKILLDSGWKYSKPWYPDCRNPVPSMYQVTKSTSLTDKNGTNADIHWNVFASSRILDLPKFRKNCIADAKEIDLGGAKCLRLSNEDMLIHTVVHGSEENNHRTLRWVTDSSAIIRNCDLNWNKIISRAKEFGLVAYLQYGFLYLKEIGENIPESFLEELFQIELTKKLESDYLRQANISVSKRYNLFGNFPIISQAYWRHENNKSMLGFLKYVQKSYGLNNPFQIISFAATKYTKRIYGNGDVLPLGLILKGGVAITLGKAAAFIGSFIVFAAMGAYVSRSVVGSYNYLMAAITIISLTTLPGMNQALVRAVAKGYSGSVTEMLKKRLKFGLLGSIISAILGAYFITTEYNALGWAFIVAAPFIPLTDTFSNFTFSFWQGKHQFKRSAFSFASYYLGLAALSLPFVILSDNLLVISAGILASQAVMGFLVFTKIIPLAKGAADKESERFGFHLTAMQILRVIAGNIDKVIIWTFLGPASTAIYSFASTPVSKTQQLIPIGAVTLPSLSKHELTPTVKKNVLHKMFLMMMVLIPVTAAAVLLAPFLYKIFFPRYPESVIYFQLLIIPMIISPRSLLKFAMTGAGKTSDLYANEILSPIVKIGLMIALVINFGLIGLVVGTIIASVFDMIILLYLFLKAK